MERGERRIIEDIDDWHVRKKGGGGLKAASLRGVLL